MKKRSNISFLGSLFSILGSFALLVIIGYFLVNLGKPAPQKNTVDDDPSTISNYVGRTGYVVISRDQAYSLGHSNDFDDTNLWVIPTYVPDKQFYEKTDVVVQHRTPVTVLEQDVKHSGYGVYEGYLLVKNLNDGSQFYIDTINYEEDPYWTYTGKDLEKAALTGPYLATFNQVSNYYPTVTGESKTELENGTVVLVTITSGTSRTFSNASKEWVWGFVKGFHEPYGINVNVDDLTIIY